MRRFVVACIVTMLVTSSASGQGQSEQHHPDVRNRRPPSDHLAVPLEQMADAIVVLVPDEAFRTDLPSPQERVIRGSIARLDKGPHPQTIVINANTFTNPLNAGVPVKLFLKEFPDRDAYYIIGVHPLGAGAGAKP